MACLVRCINQLLITHSFPIIEAHYNQQSYSQVFLVVGETSAFGLHVRWLFSFLHREKLKALLSVSSEFLARV